MIGTRPRFVLTIYAGSFLLFLVQPMIARMALPRLGGAPSVWNSAMLVYQALLLAGYAYAHWLGRFGARRQAMIHLGLFLFSAIFLPIGLAGWQPPADAEPALWVLGLLGASIGPLFFIVAAQAPLLQRWFAIADGSDPYPLYAASNLGSFAGLIAYPLLVEPLLTLKAQSILWSLCYGALFFLVYASARRLPLDGEVAGTQELADAVPPPDRRTMLYWIVLAAVPSGLMLATSLYLTTDIVAMPLLWVLPLGLYLLSFSIAFATRRGLAELSMLVAPILLLIGACIAFTGGVQFPVFVAIGILAVLFVTAVALHAQLYALRPAAVHLTRFYLLMAVGGMMGGLFCALLAPLIFDWTYEYPILLVAAALLLPARAPFLRLPRLIWDDPRRRVWLAAVMLLLGLSLSMIGGGLLASEWKSPLVKTICFTAIIAMGVLALGHRLLTAGMLIYLMLCLSGWEKLAQSATGMLTRSYFGVYGVADKGPDERILFHGTTLHGIQNRAPAQALDPTSYYAPESGVGLALRHAPDLFGPRARIDVVGLGAGTLACYIRPGQSWRFYEIDPAMVAIARNPADFTFLSRCQPHADIVIGDARMTLVRQPAGGADLLVIDAFSSDTIPMHLLTREALAIYGRRLAPHGLLLIHISNRYLDLRPVLAAGARAGGWQARLRHYVPDQRDAGRHYTASVWVALSRDPAQLDRLVARTGPDRWQALPGRSGFAAWSDDHASILLILKIRP
ncbi:fused MFS/spermidine synthase [Sphingobium sp. BYY-5]|uniref:spermidine synthase n=1 Tax=Sphingobium sp. BYY-5 TaxID=2926400 RepID=UPI001FA71B62|nr:fused MFS/spermidine synthase [Sphingobium sp. BYY-5]MCI4589091.1 fused MFS/spermidine synthase [Sphingobium sp. BYY-5]